MGRTEEALKRRKRFVPQDPAVMEELKALMKAKTDASVLALAQEWGAILLLGLGSWWAFTQLGLTWTTALLYVLVITIIGSRQRALECLIHEAAHVNLSRNLRLNDLLAWLFAVLPLGHNLKTERFSHLYGHHKNFWDIELDPDYRRYRAMGIDQLPADSYRQLFKILLRGFIPYVTGTIPTFFLPQGEKFQIRLLRVAFWLVVITIFGYAQLLIPLALYWLIPFLGPLTIIRYIGEISEHSALDCTDEFGSTRNNLGWLNTYLLHPRGDAYHLLHHLYPKIPFHQLARAHQILLRDPIYRNAGHHCWGLIRRREGQPSTLADLTRLVEDRGQPESRRLMVE